MARPIGTSMLAAIGLAVNALSGCANDLIIDLGKGDEVRLVGHANSFDCVDPAYAKVNKVSTFHMVFADGGAKTLCRDADLPPPVMPAAARPAPAPSAGSIQTSPLPTGPSGVRRSAFGDGN